MSVFIQLERKRLQKVCLITLGCPRNTVDSENIAGILSRGGYSLTLYPHEADIVLINTCCFIQSAEKEAYEKINEVLELKKKGNVKKVLVVGCLVERYKEQVKNFILGVDDFFGVEQFTEIASYFGLNIESKDIKRTVSFFKHYAYLKIAEGCNSCCSYCIVPSIRGRYRSRCPEDIFSEAKSLCDSGVKELILVAEDTASYGNDLENNHDLPYLINGLEKLEQLKWIRIMYIHPARLNEKMIKDIAGYGKVCKYLDIPLQHISDKILTNMGRNITKEKIVSLIESIKDKMPGTALRTTFIVGYPGETEKDFQELYDFVNEIEFDRLGVFKYSKEKGTDAYNHENHVSEDEKERRYNELMLLQKDISLKKNKALIGKKVSVIIDSVDNVNDFSLGRTEMDAPDVDNLVITKGRIEPGTFVDVRIIRAQEYDVFAELL